jgi:CubicO group peptidase (beta-lactamase class C family)
MRALLFALALTCSAQAFAQNCPTRDSWPTTAWPIALVDPAAKAAAISALETAFFTLTGKDADREGLRTEGLLIIKHGVIKYEKYARGFDASKPHLSWSVAKSVTSGLTGVAVQQGLLNLDDSICTQLSEYAGDVCRIRVRDPITFGTGLRWQEGYEHATYQTSSVISMLFGVGHRNMLDFILTHDVIAAPGQQWRYSTGDAAVASAVAKRALVQKFGKDAFWTLLFDKIGMSSAVFEEDPLGNPLGGSNFYATARDYARYGWLYMNDGCWNGERLLPEGWVTASHTPSDVYVGYADDSQETPTGYAWWLNQPTPERKDATGKVLRTAKPKPLKDSPGDAFYADGHWGQFIMVIPSEDVVIMRLGDDRNASVDLNQLITLSLEVLR